MKVSYPFFKVDQIKTPTMFMAGEKDFNVPAIGSEQMYQALKSVGTPTQARDLSRAVPRHHPPQLSPPPPRAVGTVVRSLREGRTRRRAASARDDGERGPLDARSRARTVPAARGVHWAREGTGVLRGVSRGLDRHHAAVPADGRGALDHPVCRHALERCRADPRGRLDAGLSCDAAGPAARSAPPVQRLRSTTAPATGSRRRAVPGGQHRDHAAGHRHRRRHDVFLGIHAGKHWRQYWRLHQRRPARRSRRAADDGRRDAAVLCAVVRAGSRRLRPVRGTRRTQEQPARGLVQHRRLPRLFAGLARRRTRRHLAAPRSDIAGGGATWKRQARWPLSSSAAPGASRCCASCC